MPKIIVIGSINMDIVAQVEKHPRPGETVRSKDFKYIPGGKGANQAIAASRLGGKVSIIGKVGKDSFGEELVRFLKSENLGTDLVSFTDAASTGAAFVAVDAGSENMICVSGGANNKLTVEEIETLPVARGDFVGATLETPTKVTEQFFKIAKEIGAITILNAAPAVLAAEKVFPFVDYLIVNETELSVFAREAEISKTIEDAKSLLEKLVRANNCAAIATLGEKGAVGFDGSEYFVVQGHKMSAVDTTAAGDCFVGAFITALSEGHALGDAMHFANAAAALSVQRLGASSSLPYRNEVNDFLHDIIITHR